MQLTEGVEESGSEEHNMMQSKMKEMGRGMGLPCTLGLQFLRMGMDHVIEVKIKKNTHILHASYKPDRSGTCSEGLYTLIFGSKLQKT